MYSDLKIVRRGTDDKDFRWFSKNEIERLKVAQSEVKWLINRNYNMHSIIEFVGNHYQFSIRQRNALNRSTASDAERSERSSKLLPLSSMKDDTIYVDGFNLIITLEVALSDGVIILCNDGTIRDIAGLRGTYSIIDKTDFALNLIGLEIKNLFIPKIKFFLDSGVSNSGKLKTFILEHAKRWNIPVEVSLVPNPDPILSDMERVITSDSIILDNCLSWFNLGAEIIKNHIPDANIVDLSGKTAY